MRRVLVTGARAPVALDLAAAFEAAGWEAHLADCVRPWSARLSRTAGRRLHRFARPRFDFASFRRDLLALVERLQPEIVLPTCEEVFYVAEAAARDGYGACVFAPTPDILRRLHSKVEFAGLARRCGLAAPATRRLVDRREVEALGEEAARLVFKPEFSRFASRVLVQPEPKALAAVAPTPEQPWAVQDFVEGEEICIWSAARDGEVTAFAAYRPLWRLGRSAGFYFEADHDPALLDMARALAAGLGATGQLSYDVIRRPDGVIVPLECNPRAVSGVHLFDRSPRLADALIGDGPLLVPNAEARHLSPAMWLLGAPQAVLSGRGQAFLGDLRRSRDVFVRGDRPAAAGALLDAGRFALVGLSRGRSASGQSTDDIEWNGEAML